MIYACLIILFYILWWYFITKSLVIIADEKGSPLSSRHIWVSSLFISPFLEIVLVAISLSNKKAQKMDELINTEGRIALALERSVANDNAGQTTNASHLQSENASLLQEAIHYYRTHDEPIAKVAGMFGVSPAQLRG